MQIITIEQLKNMIANNEKFTIQVKKYLPYVQKTMFVDEMLDCIEEDENKIVCVLKYCYGFLKYLEYLPSLEESYVAFVAHSDASTIDNQIFAQQDKFVER